VRLYAYWRSSSAWRVRIVLHHKGLPFAITSVHLREGDQHAPEHTARNAMAQIPVLELDDGTCLAQSVAILEYLEETHPEPAMLPADPIARARVRQAVEIINSGIQPLQNLAVLIAIDGLGGDRVAWSRDAIARGFVGLEALASQTSGRFLVGDQLTLADALLIPQLYNARRFKVDLAPFPTLLRVEANCTGLPAFQAAHPDAQPDAGS